MPNCLKEVFHFALFGTKLILYDPNYLELLVYGCSVNRGLIHDFLKACIPTYISWYILLATFIFLYSSISIHWLNNGYWNRDTVVRLTKPIVQVYVFNGKYKYFDLNHTDRFLVKPTNIIQYFSMAMGGVVLLFAYKVVCWCGVRGQQDTIFNQASVIILCIVNEFCQTGCFYVMMMFICNDTIQIDHCAV